MKRLVMTFFTMIYSFLTYSQEYGYLVVAPELSYFQGTGIGKMSDIETSRGAGLGLSFSKNRKYSFNLFYTFNTYSFYEEKNYAYVPDYGKAEVDITNASRVSTFGGVLRWTPEKISTPMIKPTFGIGGGAAVHTSVWNILPEDYEVPHPNAGETYIETHTNKGGQHSTEVYPDIHRFTHSDKGLISREATIMSVTEIGIAFDLSKNRTRQNRGKNVRDGLVFFANARLELGGRVSYSNASVNLHQFYFESGITEQQNMPHSHLAPVEEIRFGAELKRHQMLYVQVGIRKLIF